ncbi:flagellar biosynthetic protein FliR [Thermosulfurimonas marina]|uniref:Flagellar biosynthetic protein FliR n=1 Tax=Thermosulfurimonas marina TaxID=2047767 RepID=A0A6H1WQM8_9BACT|nr:flagellar biosynthetic protein FliR [Thermosulfurimonas marina]QJA05525.1 flagellar biosynthetic protein FliR [Thermosulfurimonas marina]
MKPYDLLDLWPWAFTLTLVFLRVSFFLFFMPLIGSVVPATVRAALSLVLALSLVFVVPEPLRPPASVLAAGGMMATEALFGAALAFLLRVIFAGIQLGGELVGMQIGFGVAQVIDPVSGVQAPILAQLTYLLAFLLFLAFDLHHPFLWALGEGLRLLPPGSLKPRPELFQYLVGEGRVLFEVSLKILAPLLAFMLLLQLALGVVSRFVPQINIMIVSFPLTVGLGLFFFGLTLALVPKLLSPAFERALLGFRVVVRALGG